MRIIEVTVAPNGDISVETRGYQGSACFDPRITALEEALGRLGNGQPTDEYWVAFTQQQEVNA
ncbi:MAG: DUF2997 domain-containing protein [Planctomycetia bacterium]|nr:DUF2997 domain-containing protein [Planctomycetia bacterium]